MTNSPLSDRAINRPQAFLPVAESFPVRAGDVVEVTIMARPSDHLIAWTGRLGKYGKRFDHSTWNSILLSTEQLRKQADRVPRLSNHGAARLTVLGYCDGQLTAKQIEETVLREHSNLFPSDDEIRPFVRQVLARGTL